MQFYIFSLRPDVFPLRMQFLLTFKSILMKHYLVVLGSMLLSLLLCACGPKNVSDIKNAKTETLTLNDKETYKLVSDPSGNYGLAKLDGELILPVDYSRIQIIYRNENRDNDIFIITDSGKKTGVANAQGKEIIGTDFDEISYHAFSSNSDTLEGFTVVELQPFRRGVYDIEGNEVLPCKFDEFGYAGKGYFSVITPKDGKNRKYHGVYKDGSEVIDCDYNDVEISGSANGVLLTENKDGVNQRDYYLYDLEDGSKTPFTFKSPKVTDNYVTGTAHVNGAYREGLFDFKGNVIIPPGRFSKITEYKHYILAGEASNRGYGVMFNPEMKEVFNDICVDLRPLPGTNLFSAYIDFKNGAYVDRYGVVTTSGEWYLPCEYRKIEVENGKIKAYHEYNQFQDNEYQEFPVK